MNLKKNIFTKKSRQYIFNAFRNEVYPTGALLVNSIPKSGTHLLTQVVGNIGLKDYGGFIASTPSITLTVRDENCLKNMLCKTNSKEIVSSHLFYSEGLDLYIAEIGLAHLFIYRDPRDIFVSEINYLSSMNRWHKMNNWYKAMTNFDQKFRICLHGVDECESFYYPDFKTRISDYTGWIESGSAHAVKYENLRSGTDLLMKELVLMGEYLISKNMLSVSSNEFAKQAKVQINPEKSHTFSKGVVGSWRDALSDEQINVLNSELEEIIAVLGYESYF